MPTLRAWTGQVLLWVTLLLCACGGGSNSDNGAAGSGGGPGNGNGNSGTPGTSEPPPATPGPSPSPTGTSYFVSPSGSDANAGTSLGAPFKTLTKAVDTVRPGDTIEVRAGTYTEAVVIRNPGTASAWITLRGYNGERPVIRRTGAGPTLYFYNARCDEDTIGNGSGNTDCLASHWNVQGLEIRGSLNGGGDGNAIKIDTAKVRLQSNKLCCSVADVVKLVRTANDVEILDNEIWQDPAVTVPSANAQAVDIVGADRTRVAGNYVHDMSDIGIYAKGNSRNTVFENNLLVNIPMNALMLGQSTDADRLADGPYETYDGIIRNNVVVNSGWACLATSSSFNVRIYNNSCYNTGTTTHGSILLSNESEIGTKGVNIEIVNNIVYGSSNRPVLNMTSNAMDDYRTLRIENNLYGNPAGTPTFQSSNHFASPISFSQWLSAYTGLSGRTDNSRVGNPMFSGTTGRTPLTLQPGSPAINAGQASSIVTQDFRGTARPQGGATDIGAYEY